jgi:hypothetical protein
VFDGVTDYLTLGNSSIFNHSGNYSISVWIKKIGEPSGNRDTNDNPTIIAKGNVYFTLFVNGEGMLGTFFYNNSSATDYNVKTADGVIKLNAWHHVVLTWDNTSSQLYVDGKQEYSGSSTPYNLNTGVNEKEIRIGDKETPSSDTRWHGNMCDMKIFNSHITEAQVTELYLKPENTPSAIQDSIVAWYPMCESNPESPQSIVYDHSEKKLGSEVLTSSINNKNNWTPQGSGTDSANITNGVSLTAGDNDVNHYYTVSGTTTGKLYKFNVDAYIDDASDTNAKINAYSGGSNTSEILTTSSKNYTIYFVQSGTVYIQFSGFDDDTTVYMQNISIKEVLMGNHATTNFFGDELIANKDFTSNYNNWNAGNSATLSISGGGQSGNALRVATGGESGAEARSDAMTVTAGATYLLTFYHKDTGGSGTQPLYAVYDVSNSGYITAHTTVSPSTSSGSWTQQSHSFVTPSGCTSIKVYLRSSAGTNDNFYFDTVSLKEVGISSTGFLPVTNEPVIPQIPLVKYNEKMVFDGVDDKVSVTSNNSGTVSTVSLWLRRNNPSGRDEVVLGEDTYNSDYLLFIGGSSLSYGAYVRINNVAVGYAVNLNDTNWHHLAFSRNGDSISLYKDGVLISTGTGFGTAVSTAFDTIGSKPAGTTLLQGNIEEVSVFNTALSASEIQELFNDGIALDATTHSKSGNLLGYWRNDGVTTWQDRRGWSYLDFDATADIVKIDHAIGDLGTSCTVSAWIMVDSTTSTRYLFDARGDSGDGGDDDGYLYFNGGSTTLQISSGTAYVNGSASTTVTTSEWQHIVVSGMTIKVDEDIKIGGKFGSNELFNGKIKSLAIYNTNKTASDLYALGINGDESSESGLVGYWNLDTASTDANEIKDLSGNSRHGTVSGNPALNDGNDGNVQGSPDAITIREGLNSNKDGLGFPLTNPSSNVLRLNGVNEYVEMSADVKSLRVSNALTVSAWIKTTDNGCYIVSRDDNSVRSYHLAIEGNKTRFYINDSASAVYKDGATSINDGLWHYVVGVFIPNTSITIYVDNNGAMVSDGANTSSIVNTARSSFEPVIIGARGDFNSGTFFNGLIDEVKIYNRALSLAEINKNYKHGKGKHKND